MDFYVMNHIAEDGSLLAREPAPTLDAARRIAVEWDGDQALALLRWLHNDGDQMTLTDGSIARLDVL